MYTITPRPGLIIRENCRLVAGVYEFPAGVGLMIGADNIVVDGADTVLSGPGIPGRPESYRGTGIFATGFSGVTITGLHVAGFQRAVHIVDGRRWTLAASDCSGNFTDPEFGWGDGPHAGGILLERVHDSCVTENVGMFNWNGLEMRDCVGNRVTGNRFSHASNVGLKLWHSSHHHIAGNDFSYGLRIRSGETHARDSASVLIEAGSCHNRLLDNDCTFGGDGIFIRCLNGWSSRFNHLEGNDASHAHNNAIECWSADNVFIRNRANHSSYGFWLGGSDGTLLVGNEAAYNGTAHANAPEPDFGHAGIAVVNGSGRHIRVLRNLLHHNQGPGIAGGFRPDYRAGHWLIEHNTIEANAGPAIFARNTAGLLVGPNSIRDNGGGPFLQGEDVHAVTLPAVWTSIDRPGQLPSLRLAMSPALEEVAPHAVRVPAGTPVSTSAETAGDFEPVPGIVWGVDGSVESQGMTIRKRFDVSGFHRLEVTAASETARNLAWLDLYVVKEPEPLSPTVTTTGWTVRPRTPCDASDLFHVCSDGRVRLVHSASLHLTAGASDFSLEFEGERWGDVAPGGGIQVWARIRHHAVFGLGKARHRLRIGRDRTQYREYERDGHLFSALPYQEAWDGWLLVTVPFDGRGPVWHVTQDHYAGGDLRYFALLQDGDPETSGFMELWLDGLCAVSSVT
ncbi:MAG: right-handed parallel beta-helix repeat-containing protein [Clostridia bacterium]